MEDFTLDVVIGKGPAAKTMRLPLPPFTIIGATTRVSLLTAPLRDRFGLVFRLDFYDEAAMAQIVTRSAGILGVPIAAGGALEIARRSRRTPRVANRLLKRSARLRPGPRRRLDYGERRPRCAGNARS